MNIEDVLRRHYESVAADASSGTERVRLSMVDGVDVDRSPSSLSRWAPLMAAATVVVLAASLIVARGSHSNSSSNAGDRDGKTIAGHVCALRTVEYTSTGKTVEIPSSLGAGFAFGRSGDFLAYDGVNAPAGRYSIAAGGFVLTDVSSAVFGKPNGQGGEASFDAVSGVMKSGTTFVQVSLNGNDLVIGIAGYRITCKRGVSLTSVGKGAGGRSNSPIYQGALQFPMMPEAAGLMMKPPVGRPKLSAAEAYTSYCRVSSSNCSGLGAPTAVLADLSMPGEGAIGKRGVRSPSRIETLGYVFTWTDVKCYVGGNLEAGTPAASRCVRINAVDANTGVPLDFQYLGNP